MARIEHRWRIQDYVARQKQLAIIGFFMLIMYSVFSKALFACVVVLIFQTLVRETRRMKAVGRYWQTKRSLEVIGI